MRFLLCIILSSNPSRIAKCSATICSHDQTIFAFESN